MAFNGNVCRLCLQENAFHLIWEGNPGLSQRIASFCQLEIAIDDGLSPFICDICNSTLSKMASLYERCHLVDQILRAKHQEATPSKSVKFEFSSCSSPVAGSENSFGSCNIYDEELPLSCIIKTEIDSHVSIKAATNKNREKSTNCLCSFCGKVYNSRKSLNIHIKTHGDLRLSDDKSRKKCNLIFKSKHLMKGFKKHTAKRRYPCEVCGKMFKSVGDVKRHKNTVHTKSCSVECLVCLKKLASQQSLKRHLKIHSNEREFECDHCRRKFNSKPCLVLHMRTHTGEKPYKCKHCDKSFSIHKSLREHERLHTGERPYACPICFKGFSQKSNMKSHFRYNHKEKQLQ